MYKPDDSYEQFSKARSYRKFVNDEYITVELSEKGLIYAPKVFHIKNFKVKEVLDISLADKEEVPNKVYTYLCTKVLEEDVHLGDFTRQEYIETIYNLFKVFYTSVIKQHPYIPQESDISYLASMNGGPTSPEFLKLKKDLDTGDWEPHVDIDLNSIKTYPIGEGFIKEITVSSSKRMFSYTYGLPCYRDLRDIEDFMYIIFKDEIHKFEPVEKLLELRREKLKKRAAGENIPMNSIPNLPKDLEYQYNEYNYRRQLLYSKAMRAAYLKKIDGKDVSKYSIEDKMKLVSNPKFDLKHYADFIEKIKGQRFGLKSEFQLISPITNAPTTYNLSLDDLDSLRPFETGNLLEIIVSLSKNTANSIEDIMEMQMDKVLALHNTLANLAEKERAESEKQKDEQLGSANKMLKNPGFNMPNMSNLGNFGNMQSQINRMSSSFNTSQLNLGNFHP